MLRHFKFIKSPQNIQRFFSTISTPPPSSIRITTNVYGRHFTNEFNKDINDIIKQNSLKSFLNGYENTNVSDESVDLAMSMLEHWKRAHSLPTKLSDKKGPVFSLILSSVVGTGWTVKSPVTVNFHNPETAIEYRGKADYALCFNDILIPIFEHRKNDLNAAAVAASLFTKFYGLSKGVDKTYGIATTLGEWVFVRFDKAEFEKSEDGDISVFNFKLIDQNTFDQERTKQLLKLIKTFLIRAQEQAK